jgi:putative mRNA 3-end processing factor
MSLKATVTAEGAILLGKYVACDAFDETRPLRVVTHAHSDHMLGLKESLEKCEAVLMTPATKDLIDALKGPLFLMRKNVKALRYGEPFSCKDEKVALYPADHILGAAQVLVEDADGTKILYTGDFRLPETPIIEADILVIEATYGNPSRIRPFKKTIENTLVSLVEQGLKSGPVYVFTYYGKIQEAMQILHKAGVKAPFIVPEKVFHVSKICEKHGMRLGRRLLLSSDENAKAIMQRGEPYLAFYHMGSRRYVGKDAFRIFVSGWEFRAPFRQISEREYILSLSDHSDFEGLLSYVKGSRPKMVITDNYRISDAKTLAKEIEKQLKIPAKPLPP